MKKNHNKGAFVFAIFAFGIFSAFSEISPSVQKNVDDFMDLRMKVSGLSQNEALPKIEAFEKGLNANSSSFTDEESLVLENFIVMEKYNFLRKSPSQKDYLKKTLKALKEKNEAWFESHGEASAGKWLLATSADVTSCYMSYSWAEVMKSGLALRDKYKASVELDKNFAYGWMNLGQWNYWAPAINGGGGKKASEAFENAYASAKNPAEKFFACIFLSQFLFEEKNFERSKLLLDQAEAQNPGSASVAFLRKINQEDGDSFFEWNKKHNQMEKDK